MTRPALPSRSILACLLAACLGCGSGTTSPDVPDDPAGIWRASTAELEVTLDLADGGSYEEIEADLVAETCAVTRGTWSVDGDVLVLTAPGAATRRIPFALGGGGLELDASGGSLSFVSIRTMVSCVDYGWGEWEGVVSASIDGAERTFGDLVVDLDVDGGSMRLTSLWRPCPECPTEDPQLILEVTAAEALEPGSFPVDNDPGALRTLFGFYHPEPDNPDFEGFSTERLTPPGELSLLEVADDRIRASFSFRGNPRSDGDVASDGSTFTLVEQGVVDLTYR